jgi:ketosteroid isomerase-like protein
VSRATALLLVLVVGAVAAFAWTRWTSDEAAVERRLHGLAAEVNESIIDGAGLRARSAQLGTYFTDDVVIDLGKGAAAIRGRATVLDMASRLQPRTSAFTLQLTDIGVVLAPDRLSGSVVLTAEFTRRGGGENAIDARELSLAVTRADGDWRISRLTVVEAFK